MLESLRRPIPGVSGISLTVLALTAVLAGSCASPAPEDHPEGDSDSAARDLTAEREALLQADRDFASAFAERGVEGWISFFDERGIQMPGGLPTAWGRDEVEATARQLFGSPGFESLTWEPVYAVAAQAGDLGYTVGNYTARGTDAEGEGVVQDGNYVTIWRKQEDGTWKVAFDTGNPGPPLRVPVGW